MDFIYEAALFIFTFFFLVALFELVFVKTYKSKETGLDFSLPFDIKKSLSKDFFVKIFGLAVSFLLVCTFFWIADIYSDPWYQRFFDVFFYYVWIIIAIVLVYFFLINIYMTDPKDSYWHFGKFVLSKGKEGDKKAIQNHVLLLAVKAFFLPMMFCYFTNDWLFFKTVGTDTIDSFTDFYDQAYRFLYALDICIAVMGYTFTLRLFNSHVRWTERRPGGWLFCIICYAPFGQFIGRQYLNCFQGGVTWTEAFGNHPAIYVAWGSVILILTVFYVVSESHFGLRFSNLTYRGLVSHGLYKFTKHPAYLAKNVSWWLIYIPLVAVDLTQTVRSCLAMLCYNLIYVMRARYEEKCLSEAPEYRQYMEYMENRDPFAIIWRKIKALR